MTIFAAEDLGEVALIGKPAGGGNLFYGNPVLTEEAAGLLHPDTAEFLAEGVAEGMGNKAGKVSRGKPDLGGDAVAGKRLVDVFPDIVEDQLDAQFIDPHGAFLDNLNEVLKDLGDPVAEGFLIVDGAEGSEAVKAAAEGLGRIGAGFNHGPGHHGDKVEDKTLYPVEVIAGKGIDTHEDLVKEAAGLRSVALAHGEEEAWLELPIDPTDFLNGLTFDLVNGLGLEAFAAHDGRSGVHPGGIDEVEIGEDFEKKLSRSFKTFEEGALGGEVAGGLGDLEKEAADELVIEGKWKSDGKVGFSGPTKEWLPPAEGFTDEKSAFAGLKQGLPAGAAMEELGTISLGVDAVDQAPFGQLKGTERGLEASLDPGEG